MEVDHVRCWLMVATAVPGTSMYLIYGLVDPRTDAIRYIGRSSSGIRRPNQHRNCKEVNYKGHWIRELESTGTSFNITVLEYVELQTDLNVREIHWIAYGRAAGWPLTNATDGGDGASCGALNPMSRPEVRAKVLAAVTGRVYGPEARRNMSKARMGKPGPTMSPEGIEGIRRAHLGKVVSPETRQKQREARLGVKHTEEAKAKMSAWRTGDNNVSKRPEVKQKISESHKANPKIAAHLARLREKHRRKNVQCGTRLAYDRALLARRLGEPHCGPCVACKAASATYCRAKRLRKAGAV
jgi:hypothetical protein